MHENCLFTTMSKPRRPKRKVSGIVLLDKPLGCSSNQALLRVRSLYQADKAGHTGSLDPLATGLLPICLGQATKLCGYLLDSDKCYLATVKLGEQTRTGDVEGDVIARSDAALVTQGDIEAVLPKFLGVIQQIPPMYSALQQGGVRLYALAREGIEVAREARAVTIHSLQLSSFSAGQFQLDVRCSKGTYIRTLVEDIAKAVGQCAHLVALRRTGVSPFQAPLMLTLDRLEQAARQGIPDLDALLLPSLAAFTDWPQLTVSDVQAHQLSRGQAVRVEGNLGTELIAVKRLDGQLCCLAAINSAGLLAPKRWLADET
jgi:tRNA pseudouridine55 synthase